jgi:hypothetical protein
VPARRRRLSRAARRRLRFALLGVGALVLVLGLAAGFRLFQAGRHLRSAEQLLEDAGDLVEQGRIAEARSALDRATSRLGGASRALDNKPELDLLKPLPVVGDNLEELREAVALASQLSAGGSRILAAAAPLQAADGSLEVPLRDGALPLDAVRAVQRETELLVTSLPDAEDLDDDPGLLLGPVDQVRDRVLEEVERRRSQLRALSDGLALIEQLSGGQGQRFYLIAVANNAEMRGSGGMVLNYGGLIGREGDFELSEFGRIDEVALAAPIDRTFVPDVPEDYLQRWEGFDPLLRWRNATMAADFTVVAPVLEAMYGAARGVAVDGVIQIDPTGLAAILRGVGPVQVPELGQVTADNLVPLVLNEAYVRYRGIERRSDVLRDVAEAAFEKLVTGQYESLRPLGEALVQAVDGRHIQVHARHAATQERLEAFAATGALPPLDGPDALHLTVQNVSANKLDYYLDTEVGISGDVRPGRPRAVRAEVRVSNTAPAGVSDPRYIFGPFNEEQEVGVYRGVVTLYLPRGATFVEASGDAPRDPVVVQTEDGRPLVSYTVDLPAGQAHHVTIELTLPPRRDRPYELLAVPSPRVRPTTFRVDLDTGDGRLQGEVSLERTWRLRQDGAPEPLSGPPDEEASGARGSYGMLRRSRWHARTPSGRDGMTDLT